MSQTYEVHVEVRHHQRHLDDWDNREATSFKLVDTGEPLEMVADALREFAEQLDPRTICARCEKPRREHFDDHRRCFNQYGPKFRQTELGVKP